MPTNQEPSQKPPGIAPGHPRIFISAAEPSGDRHAASLIREIRRICPEATFFGVAGPAMQAAGCEPIDDLSHRAAMLLGAVRLVGHAYRLLGRVQRLLRTDGADLAILVDSPTLHLPMAKRIKPTGCPVLYYIAPQLWAWAPWRINRVRRRVDRLAAILPFEEDYFRTRGVDARYVGHPLIEQLRSEKLDSTAIQAFQNQGKPIIACCPGSRRHVVHEVLPGQIEVARKIADRYPNALFLFVAANTNAEETIRAAVAHESFATRVEVNRNGEILAAADLALCASGTATLEVAFHGVPMVVMYNGSKWGYRLIGRWLIRTPHLCLVNILAGHSVVPEFMPYYTSTEPIARHALTLLEDQTRRTTTKVELEAIIDSLGTARAATKTAKMALDMIKTTDRSLGS